MILFLLMQDAFVVHFFFDSSHSFSNLYRGRGSPVGINPRAGTGMGSKLAPRALTGTGMGKIFPRGDGDGKTIPDGKSPLPSLIASNRNGEYVSLLW